MLIPSTSAITGQPEPSLSRRVNANSQPMDIIDDNMYKLIKKGEC